MIWGNLEYKINIWKKIIVSNMFWTKLRGVFKKGKLKKRGKGGEGGYMGVGGYEKK